MKGGLQMVSYDKIAFPELKQAVRFLNETGFVKPTLRHVGVKGIKLYDDFISAVEGLSDTQKQELPDNVIDFFNFAINDEDATQETSELDFEEEPANGTVEPDLEPAEEAIDPEITPTPVTSKRKAAPKEKPVKKEPVTDVKLSEKPKKTLTRLAKIVMTPKVSNGKLSITFKELGVSDTFTLPPIDDKPALKPVRKAAMDFATANGATKGQLCNISKTLNLAGYYAR
jgi:hypothetical protein